MAASPPDHLCGLGYSPADPRQSAAEGAVCRHAERLLNMVHAYCEIRDSWTGWLRSGAMSRTLFQRIVPEMRQLQGAERRIVETPSVTLLAVLDYAARARTAVPTYTPREGIDYPQPPVPDAVRKRASGWRGRRNRPNEPPRRASAREYAARMANAIEREREEEARRQRAMKEHGVTETPEEAARAQAALEARIAVYQRELDRVSAEAGLTAQQEARRAEGPTGTPQQEARRAERPTGMPNGEAARSRAILAAMRGWAGPRLKWGKHKGAPYLRALRRATGIGDIVRAERNRLWRLIEAEASGSAERRAES